MMVALCWKKRKRTFIEKILFINLQISAIIKTVFYFSGKFSWKYRRRRSQASQNRLQFESVFCQTVTGHQRAGQFRPECSRCLQRVCPESPSSIVHTCHRRSWLVSRTGRRAKRPTLASSANYRRLCQKWVYSTSKTSRVEASMIA